jgi:O-antigen ligase
MSLTGLIFVAAFLAALVMAFTRHPRYGLYAYIAVFYLHPPSRWWGAFLPDLRWSLLAAVVTMIATWRLPADKTRAAWSANGGARLLIAYTVWLWIQNVWALDRDDNMEASVLFTKYVVLFYLIYRLVDTVEEVRLFFLVNLLGGLYLGWLAFNEPVSGRLEGVGGPGINEANALGMHLGVLVMTGAAMVLTAPRTYVGATVVAMPFILNALVLTGSRGAFLSLILGGLVFAIRSPKSHRKRFWFLTSLALVLFSVLASSIFWERMGTMKSGVEDEQEMDTSASSRFVIAQAQLEMAKAYPMGSGHRGTEVLSRQYIPEEYLSQNGQQAIGARSSHNTFLTTLVEQGIPGALMFIMMVLWCRSALKATRRASPEAYGEEVAQLAAIGAALIVILFAGLFVDYLKAEVQVWLFALLASRQATAIARQGQQVSASKPAERTAPPRGGSRKPAPERPAVTPGTTR